MCKVIAVANQKGGCSKTSVVANLGIGLALTGKKVLLIDSDPQGSLTASLGFPDPDEIPLTLATIMTDIMDGSAPQLLIKIGQTTYIVGVHFKNDGGETIEDKVKRLLRKETMQT